ncbi:hypothetical protein BU25DRAFT_75172 [Macroventuria anomochaeta]|uniref:Uncharacterized protein n=1 Tax=Macroventuria anomochaeta TaxID=301207 RepID=A0ACB6S1A5_9PLEO|nr:uncharacterized protein BU25DRAFT_75172 [Macroventuria anomochaeta]KAF2626917.1 hypothetical protein BU25DRAFT_75172 [Macroventuria anomochaeta]
MSTRFVSKYAVILQSPSPRVLRQSLPHPLTLRSHHHNPLTPTFHLHPLPPALKPLLRPRISSARQSSRPTCSIVMVMPSSFLFAEGGVKLSGPTDLLYPCPNPGSPSLLDCDPVACMNTLKSRDLVLYPQFVSGVRMGKGRPACEDTTSGGRDNHSLHDDAYHSTARFLAQHSDLHLEAPSFHSDQSNKCWQITGLRLRGCAA